MSVVKLVKETVVLPNPTQDASGFYPNDRLYRFSLAFPATCMKSNDPPPPSYSFQSPGMACEIQYMIKVNIRRKGLRRNEEIRIPILYLPKSWPVHDTYFDVLPDYGSSKTVRLRHNWPENVCPPAAVEANVPIVLMSLSAGHSVSSGHSIPLCVTIRSPGTPALAALLAGAVDVRLTKFTHVLLHGEPVSSREMVVGASTVLETDTTREGVAVVHIAVNAGRAGREQSWAVTGLVEVLYYVHVVVNAPDGAQAFLPMYEHAERVQIATEPSGTHERELLSLSGTPVPALGLANSQFELEPRRAPVSL